MSKLQHLWLKNQDNWGFWVKFFGKTFFYLVVMLILIYFYHFSQFDGGSFIYNEF